MINLLVLVGLRCEFDRLSVMDSSKKEKGDLIWKYFPAEVEVLIANNEINYLKNGSPVTANPIDLSSTDNPDLEREEESDHDDEFDQYMDDKEKDAQNDQKVHINADDIDDI